MAAAKEATRRLNLMKDEKGINLVRKSFILTGLALPDSGKWSVDQLTSKLQQLIANHQDIWTGKVKSKTTEERFLIDLIILDDEYGAKVMNCFIMPFKTYSS